MAASKQKYIPGSDVSGEEIFTFPYITDEETVNFITTHGRIMFMVRGPAGTAKNTLSSILKTKYPNAVLCSADNYFDCKFGVTRSKETLRESHKFCHKKVENACRRGYHPIIVQNQHIQRYEIEQYLGYARQYNYTIIMAETIRKFYINPELLEKSNKHKLSKNYFASRMSKWHEEVPILTGWFFCRSDSSFILTSTQLVLNALLGDSKFCSTLKVSDKDQILEIFVTATLQFCVATFVKNSTEKCKMKGYYLSNQVQDCYGKCFSLNIVGIIISLSAIVGVVDMDKPMNDLVVRWKENNEQSDDIGNLVASFQSLTTFDYGLEETYIASLNQEFSGTGKTTNLIQWESNEGIETNCSFIPIAFNKKGDLNIAKVEIIFHDAIEEISKRKYDLVIKDYEVMRLRNDVWFVKLPNKIMLNSIFSGFYV